MADKNVVYNSFMQIALLAMANGMENAIPIPKQLLEDVLDVLEEDQWNSVKDDPPKLYSDVIFAAQRHGKWDLRIDKYCGTTEDGTPLGGTYGNSWEIKYWMPLPKLPGGLVNNA